MSKQPPRRLGRGLSSLLSVAELESPELPEQPMVSRTVASPAPAAEGQVSEIPVDQVRPNPDQPRRDFNESSLQELAQSLKSSGLIQPIVVRKEGEGFALVAGERRLRAAKLAGLTAIPAIVRNVDPIQSAQLALVENIQREDLNPIDRAAAYQALIDRLGLNHTELADRMGESRASISHFIRLLDLPTGVQDLVRRGVLSLGHAKLLGSAGAPDRQLAIAQQAIVEGWSVRKLEEHLAEAAAAGTAPSPEAPADSAPSAHLVDLEKTIARELGMRVNLRAGKGRGRGKLTIHYSNLDEFDQLMGKLGVRLE